LAAIPARRIIAPTRRANATPRTRCRKARSCVGGKAIGEERELGRRAFPVERRVQGALEIARHDEDERRRSAAHAVARSGFVRRCRCGAKAVTRQTLREAVGKLWIGRHDGELGPARGAALEHVAQGERHHHDERRRHQKQHREPENVARKREGFLFPQGEETPHFSHAATGGSAA